MKTLGILGGMGPAATSRLFRQIIDLTEADSDQEHLHVVIDSDSSIPDRTAALLYDGETPTPKLVGAAIRLEKMGAEYIVVPCNTAVAFLPDVRSAVDVPIQDWIGEAVDAALRETSLPVGLLATNGTVATGIYQKAIGKHGRDAVLPAPAEQETLMSVIYGEQGIKAGNLDHAEVLAGLVEHLEVLGAGAVILGCSELPLAVESAAYTFPLVLVDPSEIAARTAIAVCGGRVRAPSLGITR